jgi:hypothetical protein
MDKFPNIDNSKVVVIRADYNTGKVLDSDFKRVNSESKEIYTVFDSLDMAIIYCESMLIKHKQKVEFVIYDNYEKALKYIRG